MGMRKRTCPRPISNGMEPTTPNASGKIITALIIGLLVGFAMGVFWQSRRSGSVDGKSAMMASTKDSAHIATASSSALEKAITLTTTDTSKKISETVSEVGAGLGVTVKDQEAGPKVVIESIPASETLWVAVREMKDGKIGNILGASKVFAGKGENVSVELLRPTVSGGTYRVVVYKDVGAPDFNYKEDVLIEGVSGTFEAK